MDSIVECQIIFILRLLLVLLHLFPPPSSTLLPPVPYGGILIHENLIGILKLNQLLIQVDLCYVVAKLALSIKPRSI